MKKLQRCALALLLVLCLLLSGCSTQLQSVLETFYSNQQIYGFSQMQYSRPDPERLEKLLEEACLAADGTDTAAALDAIFAYYDYYDEFDTNASYAFIRYCQDLTDSYWQEENRFCTDGLVQLETSLDTLYTHIAQSSLREALEEEYFGEDFFAYYDENEAWDEAMTALLEEEAALLDQYYSLSQEADPLWNDPQAYYDNYYNSFMDLLVRLIALRQKIAAEAGYQSCADFCFDYYHGRSYSPAQAALYLQEISQYITPLYRQLAGDPVWETPACSTLETFLYVKAAAGAMGGTPAKAFRTLQAKDLYDIAPGENKYPGAFETYLWSYSAPFVYVDPYMDQTDKLAFAHEFGHFINDFACGGSYAGTDVAEVHSQAFEYLSLCYTENSDALTRYKLAESVSIYAEQAAYALFELQAYALEGEDLTPENVGRIYGDIGAQFGFDSYEWDVRDLVLVPHFFTDPMYVLSYVVSNDLAMQIYELEVSQPGTGAALYERCISAEQADIDTFTEEYALTAPLAEGRLPAVASFLKKALFPAQQQAA